MQPDPASPTLLRISPARHELLLGGQKSGKSRRAELLAQQWLAQSPAHRAVLLATAQAGDAEMQARIARHQAERAQHAPGLSTVEVDGDLLHALPAYSNPHTLVIVDCLTLWLTRILMPLNPAPAAMPDPAGLGAQWAACLRRCSGPVVMVSNEIGLGVIPLGREVRAFVDTLGSLNQAVAVACSHVTLMAAGLPLTLKQPA